MKREIFCIAVGLVLCSCTDREALSQYEPMFLNETDARVLFVYGSFEDGAKSLDSVQIMPGDTLFCVAGKKFPWLDEIGLNQGDGSLYDVRLVFKKDPEMCLDFEGNEKISNDIRTFSSYENIGLCYFCANRAEVTPYGMLYRINEDLLKQANHCE